MELLPLTLAQLLAERAIYKISSFQNIRSARIILALPKVTKDSYIYIFELRALRELRGQICFFGLRLWVRRTRSLVGDSPVMRMRRVRPGSGL